MAQEITMRNTKAEIFDAFTELKDLSGKNDLSIIKKLMEKHDPKNGGRSHGVYLALKQAHKAILRAK